MLADTSLSFTVAVLAYIALVIAVPSVDSARRGRWGWVALIVLLSPVGGVLWYMLRLSQRRGAAA